MFTINSIYCFSLTFIIWVTNYKFYIKILVRYVIIIYNNSYPTESSVSFSPSFSGKCDFRWIYDFGEKTAEFSVHTKFVVGSHNCMSVEGSIHSF